MKINDHSKRNNQGYEGKKYPNMLQKIQNLHSWASRAKMLFLHAYAYVYIHMCMD